LGAGVVALGAGVGIGAAAAGTHTVTLTKTVTVTKPVPVPGPTVTQKTTVKVPVPGPVKTVYQTVTVSAPPPGPGAQVAKFSGSGNQATGAFNVPSSGNYIVAWSYGGNNDCSFGSCQASNFSISEVNSQSYGNLPNDIAGAGHGSTEMTGDSGSPSFNVQAVQGGWWTITVTAAP
jgi:hypothetical protein